MHDQNLTETFPVDIESNTFRPRLEEEFYFDSCRTTADTACSVLEQTWNRMLETGRSPEKIYQMPAFLRSRNQSHKLEKHWELVIVRRRVSADIVAILPLRKGKRDIRFQFGPICLFKYSIPILQVLGSVPLLNSQYESLSSFVLKNLFQQYPDCQGLFMQAVPMELVSEFQNIESTSCHIMHGWRECHTVPLPDCVDDYLQKFSSKKRYNLSRQIRLLSQAVGEIRLVRITKPEQVADLTEAIKCLTSAQEDAILALYNELTCSAKHGLLLSYLLKCGEETVALIVGSSGQEVWHVHNIHCNNKYMSMSVGTSIIHLALQDVIENLSLKLADFGYGTPNQEYRSTHILEKRGQVLLCRTNHVCNVMLICHRIASALNEALVERIKRMKKKINQSQSKVSGVLESVRSQRA